MSLPQETIKRLTREGLAMERKKPNPVFQTVVMFLIGCSIMLLCWWLS